MEKEDAIFTPDVDRQYLASAAKILFFGDLTPPARDSLPGTVSLFGAIDYHIDVSNSFPLLLSKRVAYKNAFLETLSFFLGDTDLRPMVKLNNKIWVGDGFRKFTSAHSLSSLISKEELLALRDSVESSIRSENSGRDEMYIRFLTNEKVLEILKDRFSKKILEDRSFGDVAADLGPIYGFNLRHAGAKYLSSILLPSGDYTDQLVNMFGLILENPFSRRVQFTYLVPHKKGPHPALEACHETYQANITLEDIISFLKDGAINKIKFLDFFLTQRSGDEFLGVPFNIANLALVNYMFATTFDLKPRHISHNIRNAHIYLGPDWTYKEYALFDKLRKSIKQKYHLRNGSTPEELIPAAYELLIAMHSALDNRDKTADHLFALEQQTGFYLNTIAGKDLDPELYPTIHFKGFSLIEASDINKSFRVSGLDSNVSHLGSQLEKIVVEDYHINGKKPPLTRARLYDGFQPDFYDENELERLYSGKRI